MNASAAVSALLAVLGFATLLPVTYLLLLATASCFYRPARARTIPRSVLQVLIPAHNESELVGRCVRSFLRQGYPRDLVRIAVIADNCDDDTAAVAAAAGATVLVRNEPERPGKGQALRWAIDQVLAGANPPDAVVIVDADSTVEVHFLAELEARLQDGAMAVQADDLVLPSTASLRSVLEATALLLRNRVRFAGRAVLGMAASLCGNGMLISRQVLTAHPWDAFSVTEDGEYALTLRYAGVRIAFAQNARVHAAPTSGLTGAHTQGLRWEAGRFMLARRWLGPILRAIVFRGRLDLADLLPDLATPPLSLLSMVAGIGAAAAVALAAAGIVGWWVAIPWLLSALGLPVYVFLGLASTRAPRALYRALALAPLFMLRKLRIYRALLGGAGRTQWTRTQRPAEAESPNSPTL